MTIITKTGSADKKEDKLVIPLVDNIQLPPSAPVEDDVERQQQELNRNFIILRTRARRVSSTYTICLLLTALLVVGAGIIGGKYLYDQYISSQMRRFRGYVQIPLPNEELEGDSSNILAENLFSVDQNGQKISEDVIRMFSEDPNGDSFNKLDQKTDQAAADEFSHLMRNYFREDLEIGMEDDEGYERMDVPDFRNGRSGRFIHDFGRNMTGIIDLTGKRCFVMPLNRTNVLPPRSLFDLIQKGWAGYYKVDTRVVRQTMRVVMPPLSDLGQVGTYIRNECEGLPVYKLEKYDEDGIVKRSADLHVEAKFAQFSGNKITEYDIINLEDVNEYEKNIH